MLSSTGSPHRIARGPERGSGSKDTCTESHFCSQIVRLCQKQTKTNNNKKTPPISHLEVTVTVAGLSSTPSCLPRTLQREAQSWTKTKPMVRSSLQRTSVTSALKKCGIYYHLGQLSPKALGHTGNITRQPLHETSCCH